MKTNRFFPLLTLFALLLGGCAERSGQGTFNSDGSLPNGGQGQDSLYANGVPAAERREGVNPETDVDYSVLAADKVYFDFDSSLIRASERGKLEVVAKWMKDNPGRALFLAGHTDERGTLEYNRGLGERRAQAVREYLVGLGADASLLSTISYGQERPANSGHNEQAWAANRRVECGVVKQ